MSANRKLILTLLIFASIAAGGSYFYLDKYEKMAKEDQKESKDIYLEFIGEVYDKIKQEHWEKIEDEKLAELFKLGVEKLTASPASLAPKNKDQVKELTTKIVKDYDPPKKKEFFGKLADLVLANLQPFGRSRLYTSKLERELKDRVQNADPKSDLYATLGVTADAGQEEIKKKYNEQAKKLEGDKSAEAKEKLVQIKRAYEALAEPEKRKKYDEAKIEPTVVSELIHPDIFYMKLTKFSPQSLEEFAKAANSISPERKNGPTSLIFDLRGNVGGAIDILQYFLGPFIGPNTYAYEFFHQGENTPFKTKTGWLDSLVRYKKVIVLIDDKAQSSAEVMAAAFKKYNVGILVGVPTKGWGTVEKVVQLENQPDSLEKFSIFMVHSLTLRDDGQPIEGKGVDPIINIKDPDWTKQLMAYFNYPALVNEVKKLIK